MVSTDDHYDGSFVINYTVSVTDAIFLGTDNVPQIVELDEYYETHWYVMDIVAGRRYNGEL